MVDDEGGHQSDTKIAPGLVSRVLQDLGLNDGVPANIAILVILVFVLLVLGSRP
jgi:hypothetical protein